MILLITYELNVPTKDYNPLYEAIKKQGHWWHYLKSTWLLDTQKNPSQIWDELRPHVDSSDRLLIIRVTDGYQGWLGKDAWPWINQRLNANVR